MASAFDVPLSDLTLAGARRGDRGAQERIYRDFERPVFNLARRMTGDPDAAADVLQDTFMKVFQRIGQFRGDSPFGMWLRSIAASESLMHLRRGRYFMNLFTTDEPMMDAVGFEDVSDIDLERSLGLLPSVPRSVLWLYHVEGYTHAEIAEMSGKTASFSKSQLSRAHQKLKSLLNPPSQESGATASSGTPCFTNLAKPT